MFFKKWLYRRPGTILWLSLLISIPMAYWSALLYGDVRADLRELLPENARSVETLRELERRFGGFSQLSIVVSSPDREANRKFSDEVVKKLENVPMVRSVRNKPGEEGEFFEARWWLFIDTEDLRSIRDRLEKAADQARKNANPLFVELEDEEEDGTKTSTKVVLDFSDIEKKYADQIALAERFPNGYFESKDGTLLAVIVRRRGLAFGIGENQKLVDAVNQAVAELDPKKYNPQMVIGLGGDVKNLIDEHHSLIEDLVRASIIVAIMMAIVVIGYYRRWRSIYVVGAPVIVGSLLTFGSSHFLIGHLNASSAFLGTIVPGNGINFGLIMFARYIEERRKGRGIDESVEDCINFTWKATITVSIAAGMAYGSLYATDFLGFKHFGLIGGIGMILCWLATFSVMPALILVTERRWPLDPNREILGRMLKPGMTANVVGNIVSKAPNALAWTGLITGLVAAVFAAFYLRDPFEKDFNKLRYTGAFTEGAAYWEAKVDEIFGRYLTSQVVIADDPKDVPAIVAELEKVSKSGDPRRPIAEVTALTTLIPKEQEVKIEILNDIREILTDDVIEGLDEDQAKQARRLRPPEDLKPFGMEALPESVRADFRELDGTEGRVILALPNLALNLYHADEVKRVADVLRAIRLPDGRVVESSGNFVIYADMVEAIERDGPKATIYSFLGVLLLCAVVYRKPKRVLVVSSALLIGVAWLMAYLAISDTRINFLNFIALPITFGIGVDYAVNIYSRWLLEKESKDSVTSALETMRATGGAVILCSLTTVIGYASLLLARNGALISFGEVAIIGEVTCLAAAMFILPAWLMRLRS